MVKQSVKKPGGGTRPKTYKQVRRSVKNEALGWRIHHSKAGLLLGSALFAASVAGAWADAIEDLQGAWVMEDTECTAVFEKIRGKMQFKDRTFAAEPGFIISGRKAMGPIAGCTISQVKEENDRFSALLNCADAVVARKFSMTFRIINATHFERLDPEHNYTIIHKKCSF